jgi:hypothetical protein
MLKFKLFTMQRFAATDGQTTKTPKINTFIEDRDKNDSNFIYFLKPINK